jgi:hypothetical protein
VKVSVRGHQLSETCDLHIQISPLGELHFFVRAAIIFAFDRSKIKKTLGIMLEIIIVLTVVSILFFMYIVVAVCNNSNTNADIMECERLDDDCDYINVPYRTLLVFTARNTVTVLRPTIEHITSLFSDHVVYVSEDGSTDGTTELVQDLKLAGIVNYVNDPQTHHGAPTFDQSTVGVGCDRIARMVDVRQRTLRKVREILTTNTNITLVMFVDADMLYTINRRGFTSATHELVHNDQKFSAMTFDVTVTDKYLAFARRRRDTFAFAETEQDKQKSFLRRVWDGVFTERTTQDSAHRYRYVLSNFGGLAIYKARDLQHDKVQYTVQTVGIGECGQHGGGPNVCRCEHVSFHESLPGNVLMDTSTFVHVIEP